MLEHRPSMCLEHHRTQFYELMHVRNGRTYVRTTHLLSVFSPNQRARSEGKKSMADRYDQMCEIAECEFCDDAGIHLNGLSRCDHVDYGAIAKRGMALVKEALKGRK